MEEPASNTPDLQAQLDALRDNIAAGTRELRRYVEGNGFTWCDDESAVFNVTTAIGWMGGALEAQKTQLDAANARIAQLEGTLKAVQQAIKLAGKPGYYEENGLVFLRKLIMQRNNIIQIIAAAMPPERQS